MDIEDMIVQTEIEPTTGELTRRYASDTAPKPDEPKEDIVAFELYRLMDGVAKSTKLLEVKQTHGFIQAVDESIFDEDSPAVGLKIHLAIPWNHPQFIHITRSVAQLCIRENADGKGTTFKVMTPHLQKSLIEQGSRQGDKSITIVPNFRTGEKTNVPELIRLVRELRTMTAEVEDGADKQGKMLVRAEHQAGSCIFIRPGALTEDGGQYISAGRDADFEDQLAGNLNSPLTDGELFQDQIHEAIERGDL